MKMKMRGWLFRWTDGLLSLAVVFLMLAGTAAYSGRLLGHAFVPVEEKSNSELFPSVRVRNELGINRLRTEEAGRGLWRLSTRRGEPAGMLVCTQPYAAGVKGFAGPTSLWVRLDGDGCIRAIVPCLNDESVDRLDRAVRGGILSRWIGVGPGGASGVPVDAVSGATATCAALTANVQAALDAYSGAVRAGRPAPTAGWGRTWAVVLVLAAGVAGTCLFRGNRWWRTAVQVLNVAVAGFWCGQFLSVSLLRGWIADGWDFMASLPAVLVCLVAVLLPLLGRRGHYCRWACPYGSLQALAYRLPTPKLRLSGRAARWMERLRTCVLMALLLAMWAGYGAWLLDYEPLVAFAFGTAAPAALVVVVRQRQAPSPDPLACVLENIRFRRSVRAYAAREVPPGTVDTLLRAAMAAPSGLDRRPWRFVVVRDAALLDSLGARLPYAGMVGGAPVAVVVCGQLARNVAPEEQSWMLDCSAATENLLLAAHAMGLGAVWTGVYPYADRVALVKRLLGLPADVVPLAVVPVGYPAEDPAPKQKYDRGNIHEERW